LKRIAPIAPIVEDRPWQRLQMDSGDMMNNIDVNDGYGWILNILIIIIFGNCA